MKFFSRIRWLSITGVAGRHPSARPRTLTSLVEVNFTTYFLPRDKMPIHIKMLVFLLGKCVRTAAKTMVVDKKKTEGTSPAVFGMGRCELKRCPVRVRSRTDNKDEVLEGKFVT